jgi:predicted amidohydrolase
VKSIFNTHLIINNEGSIVGKYQKLHLFDVVTPEFKFRESEIVTAGQSITPPVETPIGNIGMQICYDVRFSEVALLLRKAGATILTYPSAFAVSTGRAHWEVLLRARAIETQCFVIAAAQIGFHNKKRESYGHAMVSELKKVNIFYS